jgi:hypothetical protein
MSWLQPFYWSSFRRLRRDRRLMKSDEVLDRIDEIVPAGTIPSIPVRTLFDPGPSSTRPAS